MAKQPIRDQVLSTLIQHRTSLEQLGVSSLELFGSVARNEATPESDVDVLVEFSTEAGLFELFEVRHYLEHVLGRPVDLGMKESLREHLREAVLEDIIRAF